MPPSPFGLRIIAFFLRVEAVKRRSQPKPWLVHTLLLCKMTHVQTPKKLRDMHRQNPGMHLINKIRKGDAKRSSFCTVATYNVAASSSRRRRSQPIPETIVGTRCLPPSMIGTTMSEHRTMKRLGHDGHGPVRPVFMTDLQVAWPRSPATEWYSSCCTVRPGSFHGN